MNKIMLVGRMTRDVELRYSASGDLAIARFNIAVNRRLTKEGEQSADFISCKAFGKTAEFIEKYFNKGRRIGLNGRLQSGSYDDKNGNKIYYMEVIVDEAEFVDDMPKKQIENDRDPADVPFEEELPFV